jgi:hydroxymethylpyrimidine pyrophosphatase-like HAD family hydrolase
MRFRVLALDYDGTSAQSGKLHPEVRAAIDDARAHGIAVILVTGRILAELRREVGDLQFLDAVVAENGAVLAFPSTGRSLTLAPSPLTSFLEELRRRGIHATAGQCVIEADAVLAPRILDAIREGELPLVILFNRSRLMILPQAVSKGTGLREALSALRLSPHNAIAIGDAENDHSLLAACEVGVAVPWGSPALQSAADEVLKGSDPAAVAAYIRRVTAGLRLPEARKRRDLLLGTSEDGQPLTLRVRGRNILIAGDPGSGKSWVTGVLCEQLILHRYSVCVIDPEGDYAALESLPGVVVFGDEGPRHFRDLERAFRYPEASVVLDLSTMSPAERSEYVPPLLEMLAVLRRHTGLPHRIVVDEAHYYLHDPEARQALDLDLAAYTLVTYQASRLDPSVLHASEAIIVTHESDPAEIHALYALFGGPGTEAEWRATLEGLAAHEAALLPTLEKPGSRLHPFRVAPRLTSHVRHRHKYLDVPVSPGSAFVFTCGGVPTGQQARTLAEFAAMASACSPEVLQEHLRRHDFSRWIGEVFRDPSLASQVRRLETRRDLFHESEIKMALAKLIWERYLLPAPTESNPS